MSFPQACADLHTPREVGGKKIKPRRNLKTVVFDSALLRCRWREGRRISVGGIFPSRAVSSLLRASKRFSTSHQFHQLLWTPTKVLRAATHWNPWSKDRRCQNDFILSSTNISELKLRSRRNCVCFDSHRLSLKITDFLVSPRSSALCEWWI